MFLDARVGRWRGTHRAIRSMPRVVRRASLQCAGIASLACFAPNFAHGQVPGELRGRVSDASSGNPIEGARVEIAGRASSTRTGDDGSFVVRGLEPAAHAVTMRAVGFISETRVVQIENGRSTRLDVALSPLPAQLTRVVTTATRAETGAAAVFDRDAIAASGRRDVGELVSAAPGVVVTRDGGPGSSETASIRGSSAGEVLVLVDGVVVNSPLTGAADLSRLSLAAVERVTVLEGSQSSRFGARALGGAILVETRHARREATLDAGVGSWGERHTGGSLGGADDVPLGRVSGLVSAERRASKGDFAYAVPDVRGGGTALRANADAATTNLLGVASLDGAAGSIRARASWESTQRGLAGSIVQPSVTGRDDEHHTAASLDGETSHGAFDLRGSASLSRYRAHLADPAPPFGSTYDDLLHAGEARAASTATLSAGAATLTLGGEARRLDVSATSLDSAAPREQTLAGAFADLRATRDAAGLTLSAGVSDRLDHDNLLAGTQSSPRATAKAARGPVSVFASVGSAFAPPSLADQFFHEGVLVKANPALAPERTRGETELGLALHDVRAAGARLDADATAYRADVHGMILWAPDFRFVWSPANVDVHRRGWQASGRVTIPTLDGFAIEGGFDRTDATYAGQAETGQIVYRPRATARLAESLSRSLARLSIETRYVGSRRTVAGSDINSLAPYWLTDVRVGVPVVRADWRIEGNLGVENLFDRSAAMLADYPFGGRRWTFAVRVARGGAMQNTSAP